MSTGPTHVIEADGFAVKPGEDQLTSPGVYGRSFATWLASKFRELGEPVQSVLAKDFGWCVLLRKEPYPVWVACGNRDGRINKWSAYVLAEPSLLQLAFHSTEATAEVARVSGLLEQVLSSAPGFTSHVIE